MKYKALLSLSGGMDSTTLLGWAMESGYDQVDAVAFTYGSKHNPYENEAARKVAEHYGVRFDLIDLSAAFAGFESNLMKDGGDIPEGHYEASNMSQTVVPARNVIFTSMLAGIAWSRGITDVLIGVHSGDHAVYADCRPEFVYAMTSALDHGTDGRVSLLAPFLRWNKTSIIEAGLKINVPYHLTRTCYANSPIACGRCGACNERREAFQNNGLADPIEYEYSGPIPPKPEQSP